MKFIGGPLDGNDDGDRYRSGIRLNVPIARPDGQFDEYSYIRVVTDEGHVWMPADSQDWRRRGKVR